MHTAAAAALRDKVLTSSGNILELLSKVFQSKPSPSLVSAVGFRENQGSEVRVRAKQKCLN